MNAAQVEARKKELDEEISQLEEKRKLHEAYALVLADLATRNGQNSPSSHAASAKDINHVARGYGSVVGKVRRAISLIPRSTFTLRDIAKYWKSQNSPMTNLQISSVLVRMAKKEEIDIHGIGSGSDPTIYKKKEGLTLEI